MDSTTPETDAVISSLETISRRGHNRYDVFSDWLDLILYSKQGREEEIEATIDRYQNAEETIRETPPAELFEEAYHSLKSAIDNTDRDVIGDVYAVFGVQSEEFGQYFTPHNVAEFQAAITMADGETEPSVHDPACGSGRFLIAASHQAPGGTFSGIDIDSMCARMTAINLAEFNLDGWVVHGNSLSQTVYTTWRTKSTADGGVVAEFPDVDTEDIWGSTSESASDTAQPNQESESPNSPSPDGFSDSKLESAGREQANLSKFLNS